MINLKVGQLVQLGWNAAKQFDSEPSTACGLRVEAVGYDWLVLRCSLMGRAHAVSFAGNGDVELFMAEVTPL